MKPPRGIRMQCGAPGFVGLCPTCETLRDLEGEATCASCLTLARNRIEYIKDEFGKAIEAARGGVVTLDLRHAVHLSRLLAEAEFVADCVSEADALARGLDA